MRVAGHTLLREGMAYAIDGCAEFLPGDKDLDYGGHRARWSWAGHGRCSCGDASPCLDTVSARKRWHRQHKEEVLAGEQR